MMQANAKRIVIATGPKRRKVTRTAINDKGEEVTEQTDGQPDAAPAANSPAGESPEKAPADDALKEQPGVSAFQPSDHCYCYVWQYN